MITYNCDKCGKEINTDPGTMFKAHVERTYRGEMAKFENKYDRCYCEDCGKQMFFTGHYPYESKPKQKKALTPEELMKEIKQHPEYTDLVAKYVTVIKSELLAEIMREDPYDIQNFAYRIARYALTGEPFDKEIPQ